MEVTEGSIHSSENMAHRHSGIFSSIWILLLGRTRMDLDVILLSKIGKTYNNMYKKLYNLRNKSSLPFCRRLLGITLELPSPHHSLSAPRGNPSLGLLSTTPIQRKPAGHQLPTPMGSSGPRLHSVWGKVPQSTMCFSLMVSPFPLHPPRNALLRLKLGLWFDLTWFTASVERNNIHVWKKKKSIIWCAVQEPNPGQLLGRLQSLPYPRGLGCLDGVLPSVSALTL